MGGERREETEMPTGSPPATPYGGAKCKGVGKVAISDQYLAIARKRLKIDVYMLRGV